MEKTKKLFELSLFIFRRDHRIIDNTALINASKSSKEIMPAFFLDERQINKSNNPYFSSNCVQFMFESLIDLNKNLNKNQSRLNIYYGNLNKNLENILSENNKIEAVYVNEDYTPFSIKRDEEIKEICKKYKVNFYSYEDLMLTKLKQVMTQNGDFYKVYTPYCQAAMKYDVRKPDLYEVNNFIKYDENIIESNIEGELKNYNLESLMKLNEMSYNNETEIKGGRENGYKIIENINNFKDYGISRQYVKLPSTRFSAYLKFGCVSINEVYWAIANKLGVNHELVKQLHWRDFFMKITYFFPHVIGNSFKPECDHIKWLAKEEDIEAWKKGLTGFPIVDSAMRCLNKTGYIHNKLRTMVCSFLVKDVLADWRIGEKYFATQLIDYDISLNNGGWQWTGSTGTDPRGESRVYNPVMQSEKLDPDCEFILKWIPELKNVKINHIHDWEKYSHLYQGKLDYPFPIFSHYEQKDKALKMFIDCKVFRTKTINSKGDNYKNNYTNNIDYNNSYNKISNNNYNPNNFYKGNNKKYSQTTQFDQSSKYYGNNYNNYEEKVNNVEESYVQNNYYNESNKDNYTNSNESYSFKNKKKDNKNNKNQPSNMMNMIYGGRGNPYN